MSPRQRHLHFGVILLLAAAFIGRSTRMFRNARWRIRDNIGGRN